MKDFNRYAALSLRAVLAAAVVMSGCGRPNDHVSLAPAPTGAEQPALQWSQVSGPDVSAVSALFSNGSDLFAGTRAGVVFRAINQGEGWTAVNTGLPPNARISSFIAVGTSLFAATFNSGVFLSTNQGESWTAVNAGLTDLRVRTFALAEGTLFAGTLGSGVFVTEVTR